MNRKSTCSILFFAWIIFASVTAFAGTDENDKKEEKEKYHFTLQIEVPHTSVKNQARTGTCWSFATTSFLETEIRRMHGDSLDLSEMFNTRMVYPEKALNYVRLHGNTTFDQGSLSRDVLRTVETHGFMPESAYSGQVIGEPKHNHTELFNALSGFLNGVLKGRKLTPVWRQAFSAILDAYLGEVP